MIRDSTGRERGANPNARSAHAARHIYIYNNNPNARSAHAARHIYITTRTPGEATYENVSKIVENDLCCNFNLDPNLLLNLISFSD